MKVTKWFSQVTVSAIALTLSGIPTTAGQMGLFIEQANAKEDPTGKDQVVPDTGADGMPGNTNVPRGRAGGGSGTSRGPRDSYTNMGVNPDDKSDLINHRGDYNSSQLAAKVEETDPEVVCKRVEEAKNGSVVVTVRDKNGQSSQRVDLKKVCPKTGVHPHRQIASYCALRALEETSQLTAYCMARNQAKTAGKNSKLLAIIDASAAGICWTEYAMAQAAAAASGGGGTFLFKAKKPLMCGIAAIAASGTEIGFAIVSINNASAQRNPQFFLEENDQGVKGVKAAEGKSAANIFNQASNLAAMGVNVFALYKAICLVSGGGGNGLRCKGNANPKGASLQNPSRKAPYWTRDEFVRESTLIELMASAKPADQIRGTDIDWSVMDLLSSALKNILIRDAEADTPTVFNNFGAWRTSVDSHHSEIVSLITKKTKINSVKATQLKSRQETLEQASRNYEQASSVLEEPFKNKEGRKYVSAVPLQATLKLLDNAGTLIDKIPVQISDQNSPGKNSSPDDLKKITDTIDGIYSRATVTRNEVKSHGSISEVGAQSYRSLMNGYRTESTLVDRLIVAYDAAYPYDLDGKDRTSTNRAELHNLFNEVDTAIAAAVQKSKEIKPAEKSATSPEIATSSTSLENLDKQIQEKENQLKFSEENTSGDDSDRIQKELDALKQQKAQLASTQKPAVPLSQERTLEQQIADKQDEIEMAEKTGNTNLQTKLEKEMADLKTKQQQTGTAARGAQGATKAGEQAAGVQPQTPLEKEIADTKAKIQELDTYGATTERDALQKKLDGLEAQQAKLATKGSTPGNTTGVKSAEELASKPASTTAKTTGTLKNVQEELGLKTLPKDTEEAARLLAEKENISLPEARKIVEKAVKQHNVELNDTQEALAKTKAERDRLAEQQRVNNNNDHFQNQRDAVKELAIMFTGLAILRGYSYFRAENIKSEISKTLTSVVQAPAGAKVAVDENGDPTKTTPDEGDIGDKTGGTGGAAGTGGTTGGGNTGGDGGIGGLAAGGGKSDEDYDGLKYDPNLIEGGSIEGAALKNTALGKGTSGIVNGLDPNKINRALKARGLDALKEITREAAEKTAAYHGAPRPSASTMGAIDSGYATLSSALNNNRPSAPSLLGQNDQSTSSPSRGGGGGSAPSLGGSDMSFGGGSGPDALAGDLQVGRVPAAASGEPDIFHSDSPHNLFQIVSTRINKVSSRVESTSRTPSTIRRPSVTSNASKYKPSAPARRPASQRR